MANLIDHLACLLKDTIYQLEWHRTFLLYGQTEPLHKRLNDCGQEKATLSYRLGPSGLSTCTTRGEEPLQGDRAGKGDRDDVTRPLWLFPAVLQE